MTLRALLLLAALGTVAPLAAAGSSSPPRPTEAVIVLTGKAPCGAAARAGSLWVGVYEAGTLLRVDPRGRVEARVHVGRWACRVAVGPSAVWVTRDQAGEVVRVSLGSGRLLRVKVAAEPFDVLLAAGSAWVTSYATGVATRLDTRTGRRTFTARVGENPAGLAYCGGRVWIGHGRGASWLTSIHPPTLRVRRFSLKVIAPGWPQCVRGDLWVTTPDSVLRLDARTGRVLSRLRLGETLAQAAAGPDGLIWVTDKQHSVVHRVDASGRSVVDSFPAGPGAFALARIGDSMWVTSFAGRDVRRFDP